MIVLALDTTTRAGGVAVLEDGILLAELTGDVRQKQGERLPHDLVAALEQAGRPLSGVDVFAVAAGPGSFTGLRVGIATMQGLAFAHRRPIASISALDALAHLALGHMADVATDGEWLAAVMAGHRDDLFVQRWLVTRISSGPGTGGDAGLTLSLAEAEAPSVVARSAIRTSFPATRGWVIGDAARAVADEMGDAAAVLDAPVNLAPAVAMLADRRGLAATSAPHAVRPLYLRRSYAEVTRDRRGELSPAPVPRVD